MSSLGERLKAFRLKLWFAGEDFREQWDLSPSRDLAWWERKIAVAAVQTAFWAICSRRRLDEGRPDACEDFCAHHLMWSALEEALRQPGEICGKKARAYDTFAYYASYLASPLGLQYIADGNDGPPWANEGGYSHIIDYGDRFPSCKHAAKQRSCAEEGRRLFPKCSSPKDGMTGRRANALGGVA